MKLSYADPQKENWFLVNWTLSNKCNYRCSYCPTNLHDGSSGHPKWEVIKNFIENFKQPGKEICYRISGGEPTYWKYFIDMARLIKEQDHTFSFLTNGSQSIEYFEKISPYTDGLILSYHPEYADVDHLILVAQTIKGVVAVNLMMIPDKFDELVLIADKLYNGSSNIIVWPKLILDKTLDVNYHITNNMADYTDSQKQIIENWPYFRDVNDYKMHRGKILLDNKEISGNKIILHGLNKHKGWKCWGGIDMVTINQWGNVFRSDCEQGGLIGNLKTYQLPIEPQICGADKCTCLSDIYLRKESQIPIKLI
jgi:organic radical activating enzyme